MSGDIYTPISGPRSDLDFQYQRALGEVNDHVKSYWIDIRDFGAVCDDSTDDAAAVQAAIDYAGSNSTTRGGATVLIPDHTAIGSTVTADRKSLILRGLGWGRQGSSGVQPYLRWIGSAGSPMLRVKNVQGFLSRDLRFIGKSSAKPSCAISLYQVAGFGINQNVLENIAIGDLLDGTSIGTGFTNGIAWEGATANNDTWMMKNIIIAGCSGYAMRQNSIQNVNCFVDGLTVTSSANGLYIVGGEFHGRGWNFGSISDTILYCPLQDDAPLNCAPNIHVIGFAGEASSRLLQILGTAAVNIDAGHFQVGSFTAADGKWIKAEAGGNGGHWHIRLRNFGVPQVSSPTVTPFISVRTGTYGNFHAGILDLDDVGMPLGGPNSTGISAETRGLLEYKHIRFRPSPAYSFGGSPPNFTDYGPYQESVCILGGVNGGGEDFEFNRRDHHGRIREQQNDACQNISSASTAIVVDRNLILIKNTHGSALTMTAAPTIAAGKAGERIRILNVGTDTFTIQDRGTLSGSLIDLRGVTSVTLAFLDTLELEYFASSASGSYGTIGYWVRVGGTIAANAVVVDDTAYNSTSWNGVTTIAPSKNAVRDEIEAVLASTQPIDSDLTAIAALTPSNDDIIQRKSGAWTNRTLAQVRADLGVYGEAVGGYTFSGTGSFEDSGLSVALPGAGTFLISADVRIDITGATGTVWYAVAELYNSSDSAVVTDSETFLVISYSAGVNVQHTAPLNKIVTVAAAKTIKLYVARYAPGGTFSSGGLDNDSNGKTRLSFRQLG